jgi:hypothetical protein
MTTAYDHALRFFPLTGETYRPTVGLKPVDEGDWLVFGPDADAQLAERAHLLAHERATVLQVLPTAEEACRELLGVVADDLARHHPARVTPALRAAAADPARLSGAEALAAAGAAVPEDLALLSARPPVLLEAGCVCFPSRWSLAEKVGRGSDAIHAPVPAFGGVASATNAALERLPAGRVVSRVNWTMHDSDHLFCPGPVPGRTDHTLEGVIDATWFRMERQTLRRLPWTGAVCFTLRTLLIPIRALIADPERHRAVAATVRTLPRETAVYKGMGSFVDLLAEALDR